MTSESADILDRFAQNAAAQRARFADYRLNPDHRISIEPHQGRVRVLWRGNPVADSRRSQKLLESKHGPVFYFPREDVLTNLMERTDTATHCPYKGDAAYWTLHHKDIVAENAVWSYETPLAEVKQITGLMAFYLDAMGKDFGLVLEED